MSGNHMAFGLDDLARAGARPPGAKGSAELGDWCRATPESLSMLDEESAALAALEAVWSANPGRWCEQCQARGWHHTDRHDEFARSVADAAPGDAAEVVGVADCTTYLEDQYR